MSKITAQRVPKKMRAKDRLTIFHFNCAICGARPTERYLIPYLDDWKASPRERVESLIDIFGRSLNEIWKANLSWKTKKFSAALTSEMQLLQLIMSTESIEREDKCIVRNNEGVLNATFDCPLCGTQAGCRPQSQYFSQWSDACKVQVSNVFYEAGIILYNIARALPTWANPEELGILGDILKANRKTQENSGLDECPLCGRFTTGLYGTGTDDNPQRCRWCLDREGRIILRDIPAEDIGIPINKAKSIMPISDEIVPAPSALDKDARSPLFIKISFPSPPDPSQRDEVLSFWKSVLSENKKIVITAFERSLNRMLGEGIIKRFTNMSKRSFYWDNPFNVSDYGIPLSEFGLSDFAKPGFWQIGYASFSVAFPHSGQFRAPDQRLPQGEIPCDFVKANHPWEIHLHSTDIKHLKTQDNFRFRVFVGFRFPLLHPDALLDKTICEHEFRLLDLGVWKWRLVWECKHCGYVCYCSCFRRAIEASPCEKEYLEKHGENLNIRSSEIPFKDKACEVCRKQPSTNRFCHEMYARSLFEIKYGAWITKRMVELRLDGYDASDTRDLEIAANNLLRKELGFPLIGEKWVTETELYKIVKSLFPNEEVVHHYRDKWLKGLELDIYIPGKGLGIEYHGEQHFKAIDVWGGKKALVRTQERDLRKNNLCKKNKVALIIFTYEECIDLKNVKRRLIEMGYNFT